MKHTQLTTVLHHLETEGDITSLEAIERYGITRLSGVIWKLKKAGYNIESKLAPVATRYGQTNVSVYRLIK